MLKLKNITKNYVSGENTVAALKGVSIEFRQNEFVAILGPSGCGKTTLLNIIGGLDHYTDGDLQINSKSTVDFKDCDWDTYRNHSIGFVFQSYNLIPHQSVVANVELALTISGISKSERRKRAIEALEKVGLHDQIHKKPNQLSGGQMQRVAIARAIVNDPEILLADEPTGALDSETSVQVMEILKEIAKDRLIIMVTHNPSLADEYANRIVRLLDGEITDDSNPYEYKEGDVKKPTEQEYVKKQASMSFATALTLSLKNLISKKGRTILIALAGSIGILGIALILSLSNGFQKYVDKIQTDTLSSYPITITEQAIDTNSIMSMSASMMPDMEKYPTVEKVYVNKIFDKLQELQITNRITDEYINNAIKKIDSSLYYDITYQTSNPLNIYKDVKTNGMETYYNVPTNMWSQLMNNQELLASQYDVLEGSWPKEYNELVIVVDQYNQIPDYILMVLGLMDLSTQDEIDFSTILDIEFKLLDNNTLYTYNETTGHYKENAISLPYGGSNNKILPSKDLYDKGEALKIVGILRANDETTTGGISGSIGYLPALSSHSLELSMASDIVKWQKENKTIDALTGSTFASMATGTTTVEELYQKSLDSLGGDDRVTRINIYPIDYSAKDEIKEHLNSYNNGMEDGNKVFYTDVMDIIMSSISTAIDAISYVLIAFTSISLIVSSAMIGIITYTSVLERTKEIGVLRSIGARKKDIARVFNAETIIIGFAAGAFGVITTWILSIPINIILYNLIEVKNIAQLEIGAALILVLISVFLTFIAGLIPARMAAKKDPVVALRTE